MAYDPFTRGPHPVGVRSVDLHDANRDRLLPTEVWYPATDDVAGQDLADETRDHFGPIPNPGAATQDAVRDAPARDGRCTPVVFSHGFAGHRRQGSYLCTHLASHGYAVASTDHLGNTMADVIELLGSSEPDAGLAAFARSAVDRPLDVAFVRDALASGELGVDVESDRFGMTGHSFGGWTTLQVLGQDDRWAAAVALAPGGGDEGEVEGVDLRDTLDLNWGRDIPTLILAGDEDSVLPLSGMRGLLARVRGATALVVLSGADHHHFSDDARAVHEWTLMLAPVLGVEGMRPFDELCPAEDALDAIRGLGLAHFDAHLRDHAGAVALLADGVAALLAARGIDAEVALP